MKKKSKVSVAYDPSEEYSYAWVETLPTEQSSAVFFKTAIEAQNDANENYHNFRGVMAERQVIIVKIVNVLGKQE